MSRRLFLEVDEVNVPEPLSISGAAKKRPAPTGSDRLSNTDLKSCYKNELYLITTFALQAISAAEQRSLQAGRLLCAGRLRSSGGARRDRHQFG